VDECNPPPSAADLVLTRIVISSPGCSTPTLGLTNTSDQGLTLVHFSAERKRILLYALHARFPPSLLDGDTGRCDQNGLG